MNPYFNAKVPNNFDEQMFLFWCDDECIESAILYRNASFIDLCKRISGKVCTFKYEDLYGGGIDYSQAFEITDNNYPIPVNILEQR